MTDSVDRRKTKDVLWMAFQCAIDWKHSLLASYATDDSAIEGLAADVKAIERLRDRLFPSTQDRLDEMIQGGKLVSIPELRELMESEDDPKPCGHPGCFSHVSHPCEGCGRIAGRVPAEDQAALNKIEGNHGMD